MFAIMAMTGLEAQIAHSVAMAKARVQFEQAQRRAAMCAYCGRQKEPTPDARCLGCGASTK